MDVLRYADSRVIPREVLVVFFLMCLTCNNDLRGWVAEIESRALSVGGGGEGGSCNDGGEEQFLSLSPGRFLLLSSFLLSFGLFSYKVIILFRRRIAFLFFVRKGIFDLGVQ